MSSFLFLSSVDREERQNKYISVDQVIELACDIASRDLESYWKEHYPNEDVDFEKDGERRYTDLAQDKFNLLYDDIEGEIISLMKKHPNKNIKEIEDCINENR